MTIGDRESRPVEEASTGTVFVGNGGLSIFDKCRRYTRAKDVQAMGYYPYFLPISENLSSEVEIRGKRFIMVGSNNYLGLVQHPKVKEAAIDATRRFGSGCTGSRFLNGTLSLHEELEHRLAGFMRREAALTFSTGFQTNQGVISTIVGKDDILYCDRENHASIFDGCRLSYGQIRKYKHNDMEDLERVLGLNDRGHGKLIVTDGVFSMSGDLTNLPRVVDLAREHGAGVMVDDAHSIGVMGENGRGTGEHFGVEDDVDLIMGTFSKSFAALGGFIAGDEDVLHYIKHNARALIFSASITPGSAAAVLASLDIIESEPERRERLWANVRKMKSGFDSLGFDTLNSQTPVIPIVVGDDMTTFSFWKALYDAGIYTNAVIPPAVPQDHGLIRTSYMANHTEDHLDRVLEVFESVGRSFGII
ncbi:MAG: aminotransferase class I/II-fold pyridoxal phosphate-dependent enzyme [Planctomycetota bacterium]|jgi:8-amino-7-oxononanoate synthase